MFTDFGGLIRTFVYMPLYIPHYICYYVLKLNKWDDILNFNSSGLPKYLQFFYLITNDLYFHELFFFRIKNFKIRKFLYQKHSTFVIPRDVEIGKNIILYHPFSTILNAKSIGNNFSVKNNVTIGNKFDNDDFRPIIGDNVYVGCNVVIIGDIKIGNNVIIGAGSVVIKDIPNNVVVAGNPAKIIKFLE